MAKTQKIDDVKDPDKVTPSATARPILVSNHSMIAKDPMMAPTSAGDTQPSDEPAAPAGAAMTHEKTIVPINAISVKSDEDDKEPEGTAKEAEEKAESDTKPAEIDAPKAEPTPTLEPKPGPQEVAEVEIKTDESRDPEAEMTAEEAAVAEATAKREQELEDIVASGKYAVPINAVQRRRSRMATIMLVVLAVLLAIVLLDVVLDVGLVHVPSSVPHTHFFSKS